jgi:hypothetical protein
MTDEPDSATTQNRAMVSIQNVAMPLVMVFLVAGGIVSGVLWINGQFEAARADIASVKADVRDLQKSLVQRQLEQSQMWTTKDMRAWARSLEAMNAGTLKGVPTVE